MFPCSNAISITTLFCAFQLWCFLMHDLCVSLIIRVWVVKYIFWILQDNDNFTNYEDIFVDGCTFSCLEAMACSGDRRVREVQKLTNKDQIKTVFAVQLGMTEMFFLFVFQKIANRLCGLVLSTAHEHVNAARIYSSIIAFLVKVSNASSSIHIP